MVSGLLGSKGKKVGTGERKRERRGRERRGNKRREM